MTTQTPDAVREAVARMQEALQQAEGHDSQSVMVKCADLRAALDSRAGEEIENGYTADDAVDFVFNRLASKLGLADWQVVEGSEEWEGDVSATLHRLLVDAGIIDDETGAVATLATPAPAVDAPTERQIALAKLTAMDDEMGLPDEPLPISLNAVDAVEMAAFGASEHACALYPGEDQAAERAAFIAGAAHQAKPAVDAVPAGEVDHG